MIPIESLPLIAGSPTGVAGPQRLDHWLGEGRGIVHEGRGHLRCDPIKFVVQGSGRHPNGLFIRCIGSMDGGVHPEHHCAHQLHQRGKHALTSILTLGGAGKQGIDAGGIQEPLQDCSSHDTDHT